MTCGEVRVEVRHGASECETRRYFKRIKGLLIETRIGTTGGVLTPAVLLDAQSWVLKEEGER